MSVIIQLLGLATGGPTSLDGQWLVEYDPTRPGLGPGGEPMSAHVTTTTDRSRAKRFHCVADAHAEWIRTSGRTRPDGMPDQPLTAYTIAVDVDGPS